MVAEGFSRGGVNTSMLAYAVSRARVALESDKKGWPERGFEVNNAGRRWLASLAGLGRVSRRMNSASAPSGFVTDSQGSLGTIGLYSDRESWDRG